MDTISVLHWYPLKSCLVLCSPTVQWYSPTQSTVVTPSQLSQSVVCISMLLPLRWKSFQDPIHPPPILLAYQHLKPSSSQWTVWPKPGAPETWSWAGQELNTGGQGHDHQLIGESVGYSAALPPSQDTHVQFYWSLDWEQCSILNYNYLDWGPPCHPLAPEQLWHLS